jgi:hypothetical protein
LRRIAYPITGPKLPAKYRSPRPGHRRGRPSLRSDLNLSCVLDIVAAVFGQPQELTLTVEVA